MKKNLNKFSLFQKITSIILFIYILADSLVMNSDIGLLSLAILFCYFIINWKKEFAHKLYFLMSLILMIFAVTMYVIDTTEILVIPIKKLSEWVYLLLMVASVQMATSLKNEK